MSSYARRLRVGGRSKTDMSEMAEICDWCDEPCEKYVWQNLVKGFCSLECTNEYLQSEGFETISRSDESAALQKQNRDLGKAL